MQIFKIFWRLIPLYPQGFSLNPLGVLTAPPDPQLQKAVTFAHCLSCLGMINTAQNSPLIAQRPQNSFKMFAKCVLAIHQTRALFKSPWCKIGAPRRIFTYLRENIWETTGCVTERCSKANP